MTFSAIRHLFMLAIAVGLVGCQSGPRWAWWKRDTAPADTSVVARTAPPALPSTQTSPQAVGAPGIESAAPPSSLNLAAAKAPAAATMSTAPAPSAATIANAPVATYPAPNAATPTAIAAPRAKSIAAASVGSTTASTRSPAGPYDPNAYGAIATSETSPPTTSSAPSDVLGNRYAPADRYTTTVGASTAPTTPAVSPDQFAPVADRYATPTVGTTAATTATPGSVYERGESGGEAPASIVASIPPATDRYGFPAPATTPAPTATTTADTTPIAETTTLAETTAAVPITSPPGQYRPGGTSSYLGNTTADHIEIASRPSPPKPTSAASPATGMQSTDSSASSPSAPTTTGNRYGTY